MKILIPILLLITSSCSSQTYSNTIPDKDIIDFITWRLTKDTIKTKRFIRKQSFGIHKYRFRMPDSLKNYPDMNFGYLFKKENHLDSLFTQDDIEFFISQSENCKETDWNLTMRNIRFEEPTSFHPDHTTWSFSIPFFSVDRKKVIINELFYCGIACGGSVYFIYRKKDDNTWVFIKKVNETAE